MSLEAHFIDDSQPKPLGPGAENGQPYRLRLITSLKELLGHSKTSQPPFSGSSSDYDYLEMKQVAMPQE